MVIPEPSASGDISLIMRRTVRASVERVFAAWTEPEHLLRWWGPRPVVCSQAEIDLRVGGRYRIANQFPDGSILWIAGEFEVVEPPTRLVYSWQLDPGPPIVQRVTVRFERREAGTEVIITHDNLVDEAMREMHSQGWTGCLDGLAGYLDNVAR